MRFGDTRKNIFSHPPTPDLDAPAGNMVSSEGGVGEEQVWGKRANWVRHREQQSDGQKLSVAIFDAPDSFGTRPTGTLSGYGLLAANRFGLRLFFYGDHQHDGSYTLPAGEYIRSPLPRFHPRRHLQGCEDRGSCTGCAAHP